MTGWMYFTSEDSSYYKEKKAEESWPPRFWKFVLQTAEDPACEVAFADVRRLGRIRLIDCDGKAIRQTAPLSKNGPDPMADRGIVTKEWLMEKARSKRIPIKAFLLDQSIISGIGNWVGDEILFDAKIHPEQTSNSLSDAQLTQLHKSVLSVCSIAVDTLAESSKFPETWLMKHRWNKGKKGQNKLPNGQTIKFLTVGGRTSAFVPSVQKMTGPVAADVEDSGEENGSEGESKSVQRKRKAGKEPPAEGGPGKEAKAEVKQEPDAGKKANKKKVKVSAEANGSSENTPVGRRRSARVSGL
jgi:DNA-formamidopyrimidine glycosylase